MTDWKIRELTFNCQGRNQPILFVLMIALLLVMMNKQYRVSACMYMASCVWYYHVDGLRMGLFTELRCSVGRPMLEVCLSYLYRVE